MAKNELKFTGIIEKIFDVKQGTKDGKDWKSIEFKVVEQQQEYPQSVKFNYFGVDNVDKFLKYNKVGDLVDVSFNLKCRENEKGAFNSIDAWKVYKNNSTEKQSNSLPTYTTSEVIPEQIDDDLPF